MTVFDYTMPLPDGSTKPLSDYQGQVLLIVNTASKCGFTPQYEGLEALHREYKDRGFEVLGYPCNQFGAQEPGDAEEIRNFCSLTYDVTFPLSAKIAVNGEEADPLWKYLKSQQAGLMGSRAIKWNFTKFLIDRKGNVVARYGSMVKPEQLKADIEKLL
ncbi:MAG: glutathione peroxidase [Blastomonas sp. CACIA14H2]|jgi:glutathione peroxidase|uniref:glutathione peroxidase n=1 Tax=unclassified Blastomonas TaxID=2626550 RepID=UPI0003D00674|nr:glutathione peroxidase [Blastomonas sp. UPD001]ESZ88221.1 MAG: glutathione peroxidase [Blastomonas sp. CACIA14H2]MBL0966971.1 glutathione peroxidase [Blastomonas sp.]